MPFRANTKDDFVVYSYEHMDDLSFVRDSKDYVADRFFEDIAEDIVKNVERLVKEKLTECGWEGDGALGLIWLPPFVLDSPNTHGQYVWHVKQSNNGTSWLASTTPLHFKELEWQNRKTPEGRPVHILEQDCDGVIKAVKTMREELTSRLLKLEAIEDNIEEEAIGKIVLEHSYCLLVQEFQAFLDSCYLVLLQESMTDGNYFNIKLSFPKAKFSIDTNGIDDPHLMGADMQNWFIKQQIISSIWKAFMFESFQSRVSAIPKSVGLKWDKELTLHLRTAVVVRNCFQHHFGQLSGDSLKVLGNDVEQVSLLSESDSVVVDKWKMINLHQNEFFALCETIEKVANSLSVHVNEKIRKRYYVSKNGTTIPKLFS